MSENHNIDPVNEKKIGTVEDVAKKYSFSVAIKSIINELRAIKITNDDVMKRSFENVIEKTNILNQFIEENATDVTTSESGKAFKVSSNNVHKFTENLEILQVASMGPTILSHAMFVSIVLRWDAYFMKLLRLIYEAKSDIIDASERAMTFSDLSKFKSMDDARKFIMESEIEDVMRESHTKQFDTLNKYLRKKDSDKSLKDIGEWKKFIEITERRNLIVHTDGYISKQYLDICKKNNVDTKGLRIGGKIKIDHKYLHSACNELTVFSVIVGHYLWQKFIPDDFEQRESEYLKVTYALIRDEEYEVAYRLLEDFLSDIRNKKREFIRKASYINLAQSYKWAGMDEQCRKALSLEDWSSSRDQFLIAIHVLRDEFREASEVMSSMGSSGDIKQGDYDEWPLFKRFRESVIYKETYRTVFGGETSLKKVEDIGEITQETEKELVTDNKEPDSEGTVH